MNLKAFNPKWTLAFAGAVVVGAVGVVLVLTLMGGGGDEQATAQPAATPTPMPRATHPPAPTGVTEATATSGTTGLPFPTYPVRVPTVPPDFTLPEKRPCPEGWRRLSDDEASYSFCLPPGWGFLDPGSSEPSTRTIMHWESAAILSPEAFPYPYVASEEKGYRDLIRDSEKNIIYMQLLPFWADQQDTIHMTCSAEPSGLAGVLPSERCENRLDMPAGTPSAVAMPDPAGRWKRLFVVVPLPTTEGQPSLKRSGLPTPEGGYFFGLGIVFEGRSEAFVHYQDVIMQILDTLEGQP